MVKSTGVGRGTGGGNRCYVCTAPSKHTKYTRAQIEKLLATQPNKTEIARVTGLGDDTLTNHFRNCVPALAAQRARRTARHLHVVGCASFCHPITQANAALAMSETLLPKSQSR